MGSSSIELGMGNVALNLGIAAAKAGLIAFAFMNLRTDTGLPRLVALAALLWLPTLYGLTLIDY